MKTRFLRLAAMIPVLTAPAYANINSIGLSGGVLGDRIALTTINVQRGAEAISYNYSDLLVPTLDAINVPNPGSSRTVLLYADPLDLNRDQALSDPFINTGLFSPGSGSGSFLVPGDEFVMLGFDTPVVNEEGPDLVAFSIGFQFSSSFSDIRPFYISVDGGSTSFLVNRAADFRGSGIDINPYYAFQDGITAPSQLVTKTPSITGNLGNPPSAIPIPIVWALDLSEFGVVDGASIDTVYLHDAAGDSRNFYPTIFVGLPSDSVDSDGDGVDDADDVCPNNEPGLAVDCEGRPRLDLNGDCLVNGADIQQMVEQLLGP